MTFDPTKPVQTRDGRKARIIATDRKVAPYDELYPVIALVPSFTGSAEDVVPYREDGTRNENYMSPLDLINVPEERELWVNVYENEYGSTWMSIHKQKESAENFGADVNPCFIARLRVRFTVGQMDE